MKRYSMTSLRSYAPAEDPAGAYVLYEEAQAEINEQSRLLGMSAEREAKLRAEIERLKSDLEDARAVIQNAVDAAQKLAPFVLAHSRWRMPK